ncbi:Galactokinase [Paenibacillus sp. P1XP2]|nr:Galactokinase [Paenibacillus sp. P1XP2]
MGASQMNIESLKKQFIEKYGESAQDIRVFLAPGRVNLIGEHIDYNGGYVMPAALEFGTTLLARRREDDHIRLATTNFPYEKELSLSEIGREKTGEWVDYAIGVMVENKQEGCPVTTGYDLLYHGEIPNAPAFLRRHRSKW